MWLDNLKELRKQAGNPSCKRMAELTSLPERTISRIFSGETDHPYADTLDIIAKALGGDLGDVFAETKVIVATDELVEFKESVDVVEAERDLISVENDMLKKKVEALSIELELLKKELTHKEEIIAIHNYYKTHFEQLIKKIETNWHACCEHLFYKFIILKQLSNKTDFDECLFYFFYLVYQMDTVWIHRLV